MALDAVLKKIDETLPESTERLMDLLRIPSISTDPAFKGDCDLAADWLVKELTDLGFEASKRPTPGHPMVVARKRAQAATCCSTATTTCSPSIPSPSGIAIRSIRSCRTAPPAR